MGTGHTVVINWSGNEFELENTVKSDCKTIIRTIWHSFGVVICGGSVLLIASSAPAQNLFVSCAGTGSIVEITPTGTVSTFVSGLDNPRGLAFDSSGDLYEADQGSGNIYEFIYQDGTLSSTPVLFSSGLNAPYGLAFNTGTGNLFVSEYSNNDVLEITPGGSQSVFATGLNGPEQIAFLGTNELFVANRNGNTVDEISMAGQPTTYTSGLSAPAGLAIEGNIPWASNQGNGVLDDLGQVSGGSPRAMASGLNDPSDLAYNGLILYEADTGSGKINEFTVQIVGLKVKVIETTFASGLDGPVGLAFQPPPSLQAVGAGIQTNQFGFTLIGTNNEIVIVEACTNLVNNVWSLLATNTLTNGSSYFSDSQWTNYSSRYYRLYSP